MDALRHTAVTFRCGKLNLEGVISASMDRGGSSPGVVVCHSHPLFGGDMDNSVVVAVSRSLASEGFTTLRFNFRGVGDSEGSHDNGEGEIKDLQAALDFLSRWSGVDKGRMGVAGYSFGAMVILSNLKACKRAKAVALVSPPSKALKDPIELNGKFPVIFVVGEEDPTVRSNTIADRIEGMGGNVRLHLISGANHFWRGREAEAAKTVSQFFTEALI